MEGVAERRNVHGVFPQLVQEFPEVHQGEGSAHKEAGRGDEAGQGHAREGLPN